MSFLSISWIAAMWLTVGLYWLAPREARALVLIALTFVYLAIHSPVSAALIVGYLLLSHVTVNWLRPRGRNIGLAAGVMVAVLVGYKLQYLRIDVTDPTDLLIPLGLSYYTFRCVHVMIERFKGRLPAGSLREFAEYLLFLPTIVIGPIHRYPDFQRDRRRQRFDFALVSAGAERVLYGYAKIIILGNFLIETLLGGYIASLPDPDQALAVYLSIVKTGLNTYIQFSGHSDIAIGFALMLGFRVMENFDWPYLKPNISAFWRSWHISLSQWCRDYVFGPVTARSRSPALGALATMVVIGLWHELSLRYIQWGLYHAAGLIIHQAWSGRFAAVVPRLPKSLQSVLHLASVVLTLHFVWFSFVILSEDSLAAAVRQVLRVFGV